MKTILKSFLFHEKERICKFTKNCVDGDLFIINVDLLSKRYDELLNENPFKFCTVV